MRINLDCPFSEKDHAKALGARWDVAKKMWYIENVEDLTPFMRWIGRKEKPVKQETPSASGKLITLRDFLAKTYGVHVSLTYKAAKQFGIPWPLSAGWAKRYADQVADLSKLSVGKPQKKAKLARLKKEHEPAKTAPSTFTPLCNCNVPPWEDCEHTDALAHKAMLEMTGQANS